MNSMTTTATLSMPDAATAYLPPIERPKSFIMRCIYSMTRRRYGKVLTPLSVFAARLPLAFGSFYGKVSGLDKKLTLPEELQMLIREQVARTNVCEFCIDIARAISIQKSMNQEKFDALGDYSTNPLFTERERAALDIAAILTRERKCEPQTFSRLARSFSEREICEIIWLIASEHLYNVTNIGLNIRSDMLCKVSKKAS